jgi:transposase
VSAPPANEELLSELKSHLPAELLHTIDKRLQQLAYAELKIQALEAELRAERIKKYGPKSDTLPSAQLNLLEEEPGVSAEEVAAEAGREPIEKIKRTKADNKKKHPGRQQLPASLPRVERVITCSAEQCICSACGAETAVIGYDESEQLDVEPAKYFVNLTRREKRACKHCAESTVEAAPLPEQIIPKSLVSDRIVIDTVLNKYTAHVPLYRQSALLERDCDITITRATMDGWVMRVGELLLPIAGAMRRELLAGTYIQADTGAPADRSSSVGWRRNPRSRSRCTTANERIIRHISGSTELQAAVLCLISAWAVAAKVRNSFSINTRVFYKPMAMPRTKE